MPKSYLKRTLAGLALAGTLLVATPAIASADTLVYNGPTSDGRHQYTNANTGLVIISKTYLGPLVHTDCKRPK